jgi:hypothetical protein
MKYILTLLLLLSSISLYSQSIDSLSTSIQQRGLERGVDLDSLEAVATKYGYPIAFRGVHVHDYLDKETKVGDVRWVAARDDNGVWKYNTVIRLKKSILIDPKVAEVILAHEKGHLVGLEHCHITCEDIMSEKQVGIIEGTDVYNRYYYSNFTEIRWDHFFDAIKEHYNIE